MARLLPEMVRIATLVGTGETGDHREHFIPGLASVPAIYEINRAILFQVAAFPLAPTALVRTGRDTDAGRQRFAAGYTGSAFTLGSSRLLLTLSYQSTSFTKLDDLDLRDSRIVLYVPHAPLTGSETDRDLQQQFVSMRINRKVATFGLSRGWGQRFDFGVTVPVVQMATDVRVLTHVLRTASAHTPAVHEFNILDGGSRVHARYCQSQAEPTDLLECQGSSTARGIGDIVIWGKAALVQGAGALAFTVDVRLPTGSADEFIGLGATQVKPGLVWSLDRGRIAARARADYTWSSGSLSGLLAEDLPVIDLDVPDEIGAGIGIDVDIAPWTTLGVDLLARGLSNLATFSQGTVTFPSRGPGPLPAAPFVATDGLIASAPKDVWQTAAALGLRFDVGGGMIAHLSTLLPVSGPGLRPRPTAVLSLTKRY